jgi:hypothetical protein
LEIIFREHADPSLQQQAADFLSEVEHPDSVIQQQAASVRPSMALITAAAHPTPALTVTASKGQFRLQAPHSMQASRFWISTCRVFILNTACGQTSMHIPQPVHFS